LKSLFIFDPVFGVQISYYKEKDVERFIRKFGYVDKLGRQDRLNFGGIYRYGLRTDITGLTLALIGYNPTKCKIESVNGGLALLDDKGGCTAMWHYSSLMKKRNRKHAQTAYVPSMRRKQPRLQYHYGPIIRLGIGTEFLLFLEAIAKGKVYYDPGIKMEQSSSTRPEIKRRSQFRIKAGDLHNLYNNWETVDLA